MKEDSETGDMALNSKEAIKVVEHMWKEPLPDYPSDDETASDGEEVKEELKRLMTTGSRFRVSVGRQGILGASSRRLGTADQVIDPRMHRDLRRTANTYADHLRVTSQFDRAPDRENLQSALQDGYRKRKDSKYKDRALPPIKENKFDLKLGKQELVTRLRERNLDRRIGIEPRRERPIIEEEDNFYDTIPMPRKGTVGRAISRKMAIMARGRRNVNGRPQSVGFQLDDSGRRSAGSERPRLFPRTGAFTVSLQRVPQREKTYLLTCATNED